MSHMLPHSLSFLIVFLLSLGLLLLIVRLELWLVGRLLIGVLSALVLLNFPFDDNLVALHLAVSVSVLVLIVSIQRIETCLLSALHLLLALHFIRALCIRSHVDSLRHEVGRHPVVWLVGSRSLEKQLILLETCHVGHSVIFGLRLRHLCQLKPRRVIRVLASAVVELRASFVRRAQLSILETLVHQRSLIQSCFLRHL